jgi:hypothetical protein
MILRYTWRHYTQTPQQILTAVRDALRRRAPSSHP